MLSLWQHTTLVFNCITYPNSITVSEEGNSYEGDVRGPTLAALERLHVDPHFGPDGGQPGIVEAVLCQEEGPGSILVDLDEPASYVLVF